MTYEYKIIGCSDQLKLTDALNDAAKNGWRAIGFVMRDLGSQMQSYETLLEREGPDVRGSGR